MQQNPLIGRGDLEDRAHFLGAATLHVPESHDYALPHRKPFHRGADDRACLSRQRLILQGWPLLRECAPVTGVVLRGALETRRVHGWFVGSLERPAAPWHDPALPLTAPLGGVDQDPVDPRTQGGAGLRSEEHTSELQSRQYL